MQPAQLKVLYEKGASLAEVAEKLDVSVPTARKRLVEAGTAIRGRGRPANKD